MVTTKFGENPEVPLGRKERECNSFGTGALMATLSTGFACNVLEESEAPTLLGSGH